MRSGLDTSFARKLLSNVLELIQPKEKFDDIEKEFAREMRYNITNTYGVRKENLFGVFSKDDTFQAKIGKEKGKKLVQRISSSICNNLRTVVVTGQCIFVFKNGKVKKANEINNSIEKKAKDNDKESWRVIYSRTLGYIPLNSVFIIDDDRSSSIHEEGAFNSDSETKRFGLAVIVSHKEIRSCKGEKMLYIKFGKKYYYQCSKDIKADECFRRGSGCFANKLKINKTTTEPFIKKKTHVIIFIDNLRDIEKIVTKVISEKYSLLPN